MVDVNENDKDDKKDKEPSKEEAVAKRKTKAKKERRKSLTDMCKVRQAAELNGNGRKSNGINTRESRSQKREKRVKLPVLFFINSVWY